MRVSAPVCARSSTGAGGKGDETMIATFLALFEEFMDKKRQKELEDSRIAAADDSTGGAATGESGEFSFRRRAEACATVQTIYGRIKGAHLCRCPPSAPRTRRSSSAARPPTAP